MPEVSLVVISADASAEESNFAWQGDGFEVGQLGDFAADQIKAALLELAGSALQAEKDHLLNTTRSLIDRTADTYDMQRSERFEALDNFADMLDDLDVVGFKLFQQRHVILADDCIDNYMVTLVLFIDNIGIGTHK